MDTPKQYILKPGNHQFAPGEQPVHNNETITDELATWYIGRYPHITVLFEKLPTNKEAEASTDGQTVPAKATKVKDTNK